MDWQGILLSVLGTVLTALAGWISTRLISLINSKVENTKAAKCLSDAVEIVTKSVKSTYQTYVEALKDKNVFDSTSQAEALEEAKKSIMAQLPTDVETYIAKNFGDVEAWVTTSIESSIYDLKNQNKATEENAAA